MATPNPPPKDITPADFFCEWLPKEYERLRPGIATPPPDAVIRIDLTGDGGGTWTLSVKSGALTVTPSATSTPNIAVTQAVEDWRLITTQAAAQGADPAAAASIDKLLMSPALGQLINDVQGTIRFEIPGLQGRDFAAEITFGGAAEPNATITVDADTVDQIRSGTLLAPQAYFAGKIQIVGDPAFAMQVGMAFMS